MEDFHRNALPSPNPPAPRDPRHVLLAGGLGLALVIILLIASFTVNRVFGPPRAVKQDLGLDTLHRILKQSGHQKTTELVNLICSDAPSVSFPHPARPDIDKRNEKIWQAIQRDIDFYLDNGEDDARFANQLLARIALHSLIRIRKFSSHPAIFNPALQKLAWCDSRRSLLSPIHAANLRKFFLKPEFNRCSIEETRLTDFLSRQSPPDSVPDWVKTQPNPTVLKIVLTLPQKLHATQRENSILLILSLSEDFSHIARIILVQYAGQIEWTRDDGESLSDAGTNRTMGGSRNSPSDSAQTQSRDNQTRQSPSTHPKGTPK